MARKPACSVSTAVLPKIPHSNCCNRVPNAPPRPTEADLEHCWNSCSEGFLGERLYPMILSVRFWKQFEVPDPASRCGIWHPIAAFGLWKRPNAMARSLFNSPQLSAQSAARVSRHHVGLSTSPSFQRRARRHHCPPPTGKVCSGHRYGFGAFQKHRRLRGYGRARGGRPHQGGKSWPSQDFDGP